MEMCRVTTSSRSCVGFVRAKEGVQDPHLLKHTHIQELRLGRHCEEVKESTPLMRMREDSEVSSRLSSLAIRLRGIYASSVHSPNSI